MKKEEKDYIKLFTDAIKKSDEALVYDIQVEHSSIEEEDGEGYVYFDLAYQIDDRIERLDSEVQDNIQKILGDNFGVLIDRVDAFPNGYAAYRITIDTIYTYEN
jgi:hypothetical protein